MEEIDLKSLFSYIISKYLYIIIVVLLFVLGGIIYTKFIQVPKYQSYTTVLLTKKSDSTQITSTDISLNQNLVDTYREIIKSRNVMGKVINNLELDYSIDELKENIIVESINDTEIIKVIVNDKDAKLSCDIANEIASVFEEEIVKLYNIQNIGVVDKAEVSKTPYNVHLFKTIVICFLIGAVLSVGVLFVLFYFDTTIKSVEEIEGIGLSLVGTVPLAYNDDKAVKKSKKVKGGN